MAEEGQGEVPPSADYRIDRFDPTSEEWKRERNVIYAYNKKCGNVEFSNFINAMAEASSKKRPPLQSKTAEEAPVEKLPQIKKATSNSVNNNPKLNSDRTNEKARGQSGKVRRFGGV
jgi:hypothetical protein